MRRIKLLVQNINGLTLAVQASSLHWGLHILRDPEPHGGLARPAQHRQIQKELPQKRFRGRFLYVTDSEQVQGMHKT